MKTYVLINTEKSLNSTENLRAFPWYISEISGVQTVQARITQIWAAHRERKLDQEQKFVALTKIKCVPSSTLQLSKVVQVSLLSDSDLKVLRYA